MSLKLRGKSGTAQGLCANCRYRRGKSGALLPVSDKCGVSKEVTGAKEMYRLLQRKQNDCTY